MTKKNIFPVVATIAVVGVVLGVFSMTVMRDSNVSISTMTSEQAYANLSSKMKRIGVQEVKVNPQQLDVSEFLDAKDELPDIESSYPFVVVGNGDVNIEIFSSGEKAAESGSDSFLTSMAKKFNAQHNKTSGDKTMSVSLRSIPSGTAAEYISTGKYQPECYTPSNTLFGELVKNEGVELTVEADPSKFRVDKKQNRLIYSYPPDGPWYELKYIADELPNSLEAEISGGNQLIMNYEQAQELFGIKFRRWLGIFNL